MAGDRATLKLEAHQAFGGAGFRRLLQSLSAHKIHGHFEVHEPTQPCLEGVGFVGHVLAVKVHGGLQAQGVPRPQAAGGNAAIQQKLPELLSVLGVEQQLCTVFAGVTRASTEHRLA